MRLLLDEDVPIRLRLHFPEACRIETVDYRGWKGLDNGDLLRKAQRDFDALVTIEKSIQHQRNLSCYDIRLVNIRVGSDQIEDLIPYVPRVVEALRSRDDTLVVLREQ
ncbi:MAG: hypothetical protein BRD38_01615 [Bacteroidetes bacterium QH_9_67_14]|nr:MAG: hypothetical protein BRD38_01615 [Bacteroidetes bacterium QH_9_67_14]